MRLVLDTNVLVSALLKPQGVPAAVLRSVLTGQTTLLYDNRILQEYRGVLLRPRLGIPSEEIEPLLEFIEKSCEYITAAPSAARMPDEDDRPFLEVALSGGADFLVTGNLKHFPKHRVVVSPRNLLDKL